jgi:hypothetical protein
MKVRVLVSVATAVVLAATAAPTASGHTTATARALQRALPAQLLLDFDNGESLRPGTLVENATGPGAGRVLVAGRGRLKVVQGITGRGALFPRPCRGCGRAIIEVPDRCALDPRRATFTFGVAVRMTPRRGSQRSNLVQKGFFRQAGGQYKLQLDLGRPSCVVRSGVGRAWSSPART